MNQYRLRISKEIETEQLIELTNNNDLKLFVVKEYGKKTGVFHIQGIIESPFKLTKLREIFRKNFNVKGTEYSISDKDINPAYLLKDYNEKNNNILVNQIYSEEEITFYKSKQLEYQKDIVKNNNKKILEKKNMFKELLEIVRKHPDLHKYTKVGKYNVYQAQALIEFIGKTIQEYYISRDRMLPVEMLRHQYMMNIYLQLSPYGTEEYDTLNHRDALKCLEKLHISYSTL